MPLITAIFSGKIMTKHMDKPHDTERGNQPSPFWARAMSLLCLLNAFSRAFLFTSSWVLRWRIMKDVYIYSIPYPTVTHTHTHTHAHTHAHVHTRTHSARGVGHGLTPEDGLLGAGSHGLRPAVVEPASHCGLITTSWSETRREELSPTGQRMCVDDDARRACSRLSTFHAFGSRLTALPAEQRYQDGVSSV